MVDKLRFAAAKLQSTIGTAVNVVSNTDYVQFSEFDIEHNQLMDDVKIASGSFSTEPKVVGNLNSNVKGKIPFCSAGPDTEPDCGIILECAGFTKTVTNVSTGKNKYVYTRSITSKDLSACDYSPNAANTTAIIKSANSIMFNSLKVALESGKVPMLDFSGVGISGGIDGDGSAVAPVITGSITRPTQTKRNWYTVNDIAATILLTGYEIVKADLEFTNKIQQKPIMTGFGFGYSQIAEEESKFSVSTLLDTGMTKQPLVSLRDGTLSSLSIEFGAIAGRRVLISVETAQIDSVKDSKQGDLLSSDIGGSMIDNKVVITFNSDLT
jgi:hypothetical protein